MAAASPGAVAKAAVAAFAYPQSVMKGPARAAPSATREPPGARGLRPIDTRRVDPKRAPAPVHQYGGPSAAGQHRVTAEHAAVGVGHRRDTPAIGAGRCSRNPRAAASNAKSVGKTSVAAKPGEQPSGT